MVRKDWREKVLARRAWRADVDAVALAEINGALNDAVRKLAGDCPAAFTPDVEHVVVLPDQTQATMGRGLKGTTDPYVLSFGASVAGYVDPDVTGAWDGIMHLEIQTSDGLWHRRQCREFFMYQGEFCVSVDRPWPSASATNMTFRLHQPEFFFKDDVTEVLDGTVWDSSGSRFMEVAERGVVEREEQDFQGRNKGRPEKMTRGRHFQLQGPATQPTVLQPDQTTWLGKEPLGTFRFCYTYVWGKRDAEFKDEFGQYDPMWESSPSPASAAVAVTTAPATILRIASLTNIDYMINFDPPATAGIFRYGHSGLRKRIYVARDATSTAGAFEDNVEARSAFVFLAEVDGATDHYDWDGSVLPNPFRRLPEVTGYFAYSLVPHQDKTYQIDFRVRRRPVELSNDYDAPKVQPDSQEALNLLALYYVAQLDKQLDAAAEYLEQYTGNPNRRIEGELPKLLRKWGNTAKVLPAGFWNRRNFQSDIPWESSRGNYFRSR